VTSGRTELDHQRDIVADARRRVALESAGTSHKVGRDDDDDDDFAFTVIYTCDNMNKIRLPDEDPAENTDNLEFTRGATLPEYRNT